GQSGYAHSAEKHLSRTATGRSPVGNLSATANGQRETSGGRDHKKSLVIDLLAVNKKTGADLPPGEIRSCLLLQELQYKNITDQTSLIVSFSIIF
ncbi:MAG: hypothetical protein IKT07_02270, partial [Oscillospiraceae bacterium]|nr:hypothetical protein [Oscillospiraceae bacterium]